MCLLMRKYFSHVVVFFFSKRRPQISTRTDTLFPFTTLFRSLRHAAILKMPPELRRDRLELLDQCIAGFVAGHVERPVCQSARQRGPGSARKRGPPSHRRSGV